MISIFTKGFSYPAWMLRAALTTGFVIGLAGNVWASSAVGSPADSASGAATASCSPADSASGSDAVAAPVTSDLKGEGAPLPVPDEFIAKEFEGYKGCFVEAGPDHKSYLLYNPEQAGEKLSPCSTYKIMNSLIGLECGVLKDENHPMKWDGTKHDIESWNQDQTLKSAVADSVVWYFQNVAKAVGARRMQHYLNLVGYGNADISGGLTTFWLGSSLKISAHEQVDLIERLERSRLPFSQRNIDITKKLILLKTTELGELHGKTGSSKRMQSQEQKSLGWFVGYVIHRGKPYYFATNILGDGAWGKKARAITEEILAKQGLL